MILKITEATGRVVIGYVQGVGGLASLFAVERAVRRASARQPTLIFEPEMGKAQVFTNSVLGAFGPSRLANLYRAKVEAFVPDVHVAYDGDEPHYLTACAASIEAGDEMREDGESIVPRRLAARATCKECIEVMAEETTEACA